MEIVIRNLFKNYGKKTALENVSVTIHSGMYGLLGRNGAGKTSLMRILATLSEASGGEISMNGIPIKETGKIREIVGYLPQDFSFYRGMSVYGAMDYLGLLSEIPDKIRRKRILALLEQGLHRHCYITRKSLLLTNRQQGLTQRNVSVSEIC